MSFIDNFVSRFKDPGNDSGYLDDDYFDEEEEDEYYPPKKKSASSKASVRSIFSRPEVEEEPVVSEMQVITIKPSGMEDSKVICDALLGGKAVILNMESISSDIAQRIIDFTLGAIYAIQGNLQMVSKYIFVASPMNVQLTGDFMGDFSGKSAQDPLNNRQQTSDRFRFNA